MTKRPFLLYPDADAVAKDTKRRILLLYGDAGIQDGRAFRKDGRGDSCRDVLQEIRRHGHLPADNTDKARIVGCAFKPVILPCRCLNIDKSRDGDIEVCPDGALLRRHTMTGIHLDAIDTYFSRSIHYLLRRMSAAILADTSSVPLPRLPSTS